MNDEKAPDLQNTPVPGSGRRIGPYLLVRKLGEGGMGAVWLAEQQEPVHRTVALKLIRAGMDSESVLRRFSSERQALALMRHPAIARVYDAGSTPDGSPYFVMEHVDGVPITDYCDARRLTIPQRLELFVTVCEGIQHAHQKAILHRDLKPSNVLVEEQDGKPAVKIIDFGLAKSIGSETAQITMASEVVGTPRYMSPEQLDFGPDDVDTRADVYSLGVMLYELLTGTTPHSESRAFDELLSHIRLGDVGPPSSRFAKTTEASIAAAEKCGATPETIRKQLAGDLDWITVRALATDREQRYSSASDFAADILRHLHDEPVQARRPSAAYRMAKFARRNRLSVMLGGLAATLVVGLAVTMTVQAKRIAKERDRANHEAETTRGIAQFLTRMFAVSDPSEARGNNITAREILDNASQQIESNLKQSPEVRGQLMYAMADAYLGLGLSRKAKALLDNAIALQSQALGKENPTTLRSMTRLGYTLGILGEYSDAETLLRSTFETERRILGPDNVDVLSTAGYLAEVLAVLGRNAETEKLLLETIRAQSKIFGPEAGQTLRSQRTLSKTLLDERKYQEAEKQIRDTLAVHRRVFGPEHPATLYEANLFGISLNYLRRYAEAEKVLRDLLEIQKRVLGPAHPNTIATVSNLALAVNGQGRRSEAIALYRDALESQTKMFGPDHLNTLNVENDLAIALDDDHQFAEAATLFRTVLEKRRQKLPPGHPRIIDGICSLGTTLAYLGRHAEAERMFQDAVREAQHSEGSAPLAEAYFHYGVGAALAGDRPKALELLEKAVGLGLDPVTYDFSKENDLKSMRGDAHFDALAARMHSPAGIDRK